MSEEASEFENGVEVAMMLIEEESLSLMEEWADP